MSDARAFHYHRAVAPTLWALAAIAGVELVVTHLLLAHWFPRAALALSLLTLGAVGWLAAGAASMKRLPVLLGDGRLVMRAGRIKGADMALADVAGLAEGWDAALVRRRSTLNLALAAYPNVVVALCRPLPGRRGVERVAHRLDDPAGFAAALGEALALLPGSSVTPGRVRGDEPPGPE